jgi:hypothetical protein
MPPTPNGKWRDKRRYASLHQSWAKPLNKNEERRKILRLLQILRLAEVH